MGAMSASQDQEDAGSSGGEEGPDIYYLSQKVLEQVKEHIKKGDDISKEILVQLTSPEDLPESDIVVPCDLKGIGDEMDDLDNMIEALGTKKTAEAFVRAHNYFEEHKEETKEEDRPKPMTAKEWKELVEAENDLDVEDSDSD